MNISADADLCLTEITAAFVEARSRAARIHKPVLASISFPVDTLEPLHLFSTCDDALTQSMLWESRAPAVNLFGLGCALELTAHGAERFAHIDHQWRALVASAVIVGPEGPRLLGGFRFDTEGARASHWSNFSDASMVVANLLVVRNDDSCFLICQQMVDRHDDPALLAARCREQIAALVQPRQRQQQGSRCVSLLSSEAVAENEWRAKVQNAIAAIRQGDLHKVVLARDVYQQYSAEIAPHSVVQSLRDGDTCAHIFCIRRGAMCFLGATPERLVRVDAAQIHTHALAGTGRRDADPKTDQLIGQQLLSCAKERHEHALVVEAIRAALVPLVENLQVAEIPHLRRLPAVQHLSTPISALMRKSVSVLDLVAALHPTPAVAGHTRDKALAYIRAHEGFDRGWYAAPLGWIDANGNGDFIVALRSALIAGSSCRLFAGCGIVEASDPALEYQETCLKLSGMQKAICSSLSAEYWPR